MFFWKKKPTSSVPEGAKDLDIQPGGYYVLKNQGAYQLFRLLDFTQTTYHVQPFEETFDHLPIQAELALLHPQSLHAARETKELLGHELTLIKTAPLTPEDLSEYSEYLQANGYEQTEIDTISERLIASSATLATKMRLLPTDSGVTLTTLEDPAKG